MQINLSPTSSLWTTIQWLGVLLSAVLVGAFIYYPAPTLSIFWNVVIPLLPATFLISPLIWRSVCPIATLNMVGNGQFGRRMLKAASIPRASLLGIGLFALMVPGRHFLFNESGTAMVAAILLVFLTALISGTFYHAKSGFCNTLCPVLPVEKLYGQHPLLEMKNPRCASCELCTPRGCIDLSPQKSIEKVISPAHRSTAWVRTPMGIFAMALPGFITAYFIATGPELADAPLVYLFIAGASLISVMLFSSLALLWRWQASRAFLILGALSISLYYGFVAPQMATALHLGTAGAWTIRIGAFALIGFWLWKAIRRTSREERAAPMRSRPIARTTPAMAARDTPAGS